MLSNLGVDFDIISSEFDEHRFIEEQISKYGNITPERQTVMLALEKARYVFSHMDVNYEYVIIGADTSVVVDGKILGKPRDRQDALNMLRLLGGKTHKVVSGFAIIDNSGKTYTDYDETLVHMRNISIMEAEKYVDSEYVLDKAGAYAIQGKASLFIEGIQGCYFNVVGLPIFKLAQALRNFDIDLSCGGI